MNTKIISIEIPDYTSEMEAYSAKLAALKEKQESDYSKIARAAVAESMVAYIRETLLPFTNSDIFLPVLANEDRYHKVDDDKKTFIVGYSVGIKIFDDGGKTPVAPAIARDGTVTLAVYYGVIRPEWHIVTNPIVYIQKKPDIARNWQNLKSAVNDTALHFRKLYEKEIAKIEQDIDAFESFEL